MSAAVARNHEIHHQVEALRVMICAGLRYAPGVLLALLLGLLNPSLCLFHCYLSHSMAATSGTSLSHEHHSQHADPAPVPQQIAPCAMTDAPSAAHFMPRAAYEFTLTGLLLTLFAPVAVASTPRPPWHLPTSQRSQPPTPPPQTF